MKRTLVARAMVGVIAGALWGGATACDMCAGTPSCHMEPSISYVGQLIEFPTGRAVPGVQVTFVREAGIHLIGDTVRATTDADGFFVLRAGATDEGSVIGSATVVPPAPGISYTVRGLRLTTQETRGDGGSLGRWTVNPYLTYIGELHDPGTYAPVTDAKVVITQLGSERAAPATLTTRSADNGRFMWTPTIIDYGPIDVEVAVTSSAYPRTYRLRTTIQPQYRADEGPQLEVLFVGPGFYKGVVYRRGTKEFIPGVRVDFARTSGIHGTPDNFSVTSDEYGTFPIPITFGRSGTMIGELTIYPPAPLPVETVHGVAIEVFDGGETRILGSWGFGAAIIPRPVFVYRATGDAIKEGTWVQFTRVGGLPIVPAPWAQPDSGVRIADAFGTVAYDAATDDSGSVIMDLKVLLNYPHSPDTIHSVAFPARYSDAAVIDTFRVGRWYPYVAELHASDSDQPVAGLTVQFQRTAGARVYPETFTATSRADGIVPLQATAPLDTGTVDGTIKVLGGGVYRDTTVTVHLHGEQDDVIRNVGIIRLNRAP